MRILHWNIHMWTDADGIDNVDRVIDVIRDADPDLVSLVEVDELWGRPTRIQRVAETLGYHWVFVPAFEYREAGGFGNAVLSKRPVQSVQQWQLLPPMLYDASEPTEPRTVVLARVTVDEQLMAFGSTHLPRSNDDLRKHATDRLLELTDHLDAPYVICGDFNQPPTSWVPASLTVGPHEPVATYPTSAPCEPIDYAVGRGLRLASAGTVDSSASDHLPIVIEASPS